uniref:Odorant receptor n=1 Tax=Aulacocentrum confusum TaxID=2767324 RepID=A0A7G8Z943_9HYME|nr:olfactory receptor 24 [Aulacocentrum confusum]
MARKTSIDTYWNSKTIFAFGLYRYIGQILGIWPTKCENFISIFSMLFAAFTQITMIFEIIAEVIITKQVNPQNMSFMSCNFLSLIKIIIIRLNYKKMKLILETLVDAWNTELDKTALKIMQSTARLERKICIYELGTTYFVIVPTIFFAIPYFGPNGIINGTDINLRSYPVQTPHVFAGLSTWMYCILFIFQSIQLILTCTGNVGNDCWFFGFAMCLRARIQCLSLKFQNLDFSTKDLVDRNISEIVEKHIHLVKLAQNLEHTFKFIILCIVVFNVSQVCFYGIQMIRCIKSGDIVIIINTLICIFLLNFQIYLYSWAGDELSSSIEDIRLAAFNSPWYDTSLRHKRDIIFIMTRTQSTFALTAGKIYRMDLDSFKNIIKAIASYFSVMQAMFNE